MKLPVLLALCGLLVMPASARTFTNTAGKSINGDVVSATKDTVTLKLTNGKTTKFKISLLSEADQEFVAKWRADQLPNVRVTPNFVRSNRDTTRANDYYDDDRQVQNLSMTVEVETFDANKGIEGGEFSYILVGRDMKTRNRYIILRVQTQDLDITPGGSTELKFKTVKNFYTDSSYYKKGARCVGYVLYAKRKSDDREIHASASSPLLEKAIHSIVTLKTGEMTDANFIPIPPEGKKKKDGEGGGDVISVK